MSNMRLKPKKQKIQPAPAEAIRKVVLEVLIRNEGNRITPELINGIIVAINQNMQPAPAPPGQPSQPPVKEPTPGGKKLPEQ